MLDSDFIGEESIKDTKDLAYDYFAMKKKNMKISLLGKVFASKSE